MVDTGEYDDCGGNGEIEKIRICGGFLAHVQKGNHRLFFIVCCLRKARTRDLLRFLLDPCIHDLPFADNSLLRSSDSRSVAEISTDLATEALQWSRCFCFSLSSIEKHSPAFPFLYTAEGNSLPPRQCTQEIL